MIVFNQVSGCRHIAVQNDCNWCDLYKYQMIRECDRCRQVINADEVYLAITGQRPQLICTCCRIRDEVLRGNNETRSSRK